MTSEKVASRAEFFIVVLCVLAAWACGGGNSQGGSQGAGGAPSTGGAGNVGGGDGGTVDPQLAVFCASVTDATATFLSRCRGLSSQVARNLVTDPCVAWKPAVAKGRMAFDATAAGACIADLGSLACDANAAPASCNQVLSGQVADGAACSLLIQTTLFSECEAGSACAAALTSTCQGTCTKLASLNQACGSGVRCVSGATCSAATNTCVPKGAVNAPCGLNSSPECQAGLACSDMLSGTCVALATVGATCTQSSQCAPPLVCDRGANITGTCQAPMQPGDNCTVNDYQCDTGLSYCGSDGKCHAQPGLGQSCPVNDGETGSCVIGTCDSAATPSVCKIIAAGQPCSINADCGPGALCAMDFATSSEVCTASCL